MPPRIPTLQRLGAANLCLAPVTKPAVPNFLPIVQTANLSQREKERKAKAQRDPYRWAQAQQRKNANLKRREEIANEKSAGWGDPIWGKSTPFVESLDTVGAADAEPPKVGALSFSTKERDPSTDKVMRNHYVTDDELADAVKQAFDLSKPMVGMIQSQMDPEVEAETNAKHKADHQKAVEALRRITALENSSTRDRYHINVQRVIDELGRHRTDAVLKPKPASIHASQEPKVPRAGPDTGSSEVQIGILTAKIRGLAQSLQSNRAYKDKHNRRNLRVLLHRRQKLLKYMERKERGSERWTNMLEKLGLTPATWKSQIDL